MPLTRMYRFQNIAGFHICDKWPSNSCNCSNYDHRKNSYYSDICHITFSLAFYSLTLDKRGFILMNKTPSAITIAIINREPSGNSGIAVLTVTVPDNHGLGWSK